MQPELLYIYKVYEEGSFSKAAEKLYMTQPALSISIQKMEANIGMPLFDRSRRPMQLTDAGKIYIDSIKNMMELEHSREQQINDIQNLLTGSIKLGGSHYLNSYILPDALAAFSRTYPGITLEIVEAGSDVLAEMLSERAIDLTFSCNEAFMRDFERYPMFEDHILLAVPDADPINEKMRDFALSPKDIINGEHLKETCPAVKLKAFSDLDFILLTSGNNLHHRALNMFEQADVTPKIKLNLSQMVTAYHLAAAGFAATFTSDRIIKNANDAVCLYKIDTDLSMRTFYALLPDRHYTSRAVKMLIQYLLLNV